MAQKFQSLQDVFVAELNDIYSAEQQIVDAMPAMINAASSSQLKSKFETHLKQTCGQVDRLNKVFDMLGMKPEKETCEGMAGILQDGKKVVIAQGDAAAKDAALIAAAQKVEHYEISSYGTLRSFANMLGHTDIAQQLGMILQEESSTDKLLTQLAEQSINKKAA